jgi:outer membrane protein TolC
MALRNNKQLGISRLKQETAKNIRKSARTKYLPHVNAIGGYMYTSRPVSILSNDQMTMLNATGALVSGGVQSMGNILQTSPTIGNLLTNMSDQLTAAFDTDTRHVMVGSVTLLQPLFMGGSIIAMNKMADIAERIAANTFDATEQATLYNIDIAYWQVVSLRHKKLLAESYLEVVKKLASDVSKMIDEGVATKSQGLSVDVKVNEAEMNVTKVTDGLVLSKMLLCQLCGIPLSEKIVLEDETKAELGIEMQQGNPNVEAALANRPELQMLENVVELGHQGTNVLKAGNLPQVLLTGGYMVSNPSLVNGFRRRFEGMWNAGVMLRIPLWNWGDVRYKVRAAKSSTAIARLELEEAREKVELQVNQVAFKVDESNKKLAMARTNIKRAEENLRTANLGFKEGVIQVSTVMEAQTAWLQAKSQEIDAEIDVKLSQVEMRKALGELRN